MVPELPRRKETESGTFYFADHPRGRGPIQKIGTMISTLKCGLLDTQYA